MSASGILFFTNLLMLFSTNFVLIFPFLKSLSLRSFFNKSKFVVIPAISNSLR